MPAFFKPLCAAVLMSFAASFACAASKGTILSAPRKVAASPTHADAQPQASVAGHEAQLTVAAGKGEMVRLTEPATAVFVADPEIADVNVPNPRAVFVLGKKAGTTTLYVLGANNKQVLRQTIVVSQDVTTLDSILRTRFPALHLNLISAPGSLMISGDVNNAAEADAIVQTLTPYMKEKEQLINRLSIPRPQQVQLRVRITEIDRNVTQQLGINWSTISNFAGNFSAGVFSGRQIMNLNTTPNTVNLPSNNAFSVLGGFSTSHTNIQALIDALNQEGLISVLAEPNLVALSGQTASFLAGGEFPIPIQQQDNAITIEFKQFGVKLDFTPTVLADNHISLKVRPEVSQLDSGASITTGGITIPGLSVRRLDTTVELSSGQSFAIGGLLQANTNDVISQVPGLGSLPVLGKLFTSTNYQNNKTELVVIVTPYIVQPTDPGRLRTPTDSMAVLSPSSDVEYTYQKKIGLDPLSASTPRLVGAAGFIY
ncbi:pilus assembly protein CpaC [Paraburkholderia sp. GAS199]|uniref:type II and III secretion system protein family protein n=1 Tax=Paraburkholderia sp. GAS199 TaxID=3035126 RepID=UPI003D1E7520